VVEEYKKEYGQEEKRIEKEQKEMPERFIAKLLYK